MRNLSKNINEELNQPLTVDQFCCCMHEHLAEFTQNKFNAQKNYANIENLKMQFSGCNWNCCLSATATAQGLWGSLWCSSSKVAHSLSFWVSSYHCSIRNKLWTEKGLSARATKIKIKYHNTIQRWCTYKNKELKGQIQKTS